MKRKKLEDTCFLKPCLNTGSLKARREHSLRGLMMQVFYLLWIYNTLRRGNWLRGSRLRAHITAIFLIIVPVQAQAEQALVCRFDTYQHLTSGTVQKVDSGPMTFELHYYGSQLVDFRPSENFYCPNMQTTVSNTSIRWNCAWSNEGANDYYKQSGTINRYSLSIEYRSFSRHGSSKSRELWTGSCRPSARGFWLPGSLGYCLLLWAYDLKYALTAVIT